MLLLRAEECLLCVALDVVEAVHEQRANEGSRAEPVDVVDWASVSGLGQGSDRANGSLVVVRTPSGPIGLHVDACLGIRDVSFLDATPVPSRRQSPEGRPLCFLLHIDGRPHFLIEPGALTYAREAQVAGRNSATGTAPRTAVGG